MMKMTPPVIYLPAETIEPMQRDPAAVHAARPRPAAVRAAADRAGRRDRALARTGRDGRRHAAHGAVAGLRRVGSPPEAEARVSGLSAATRFATCAWPARK